MTTFSKYLQAKMDEKGWKQADLAKASGINPKSISEYMNLGVIPQASRLAKIAQALGAAESEVRRAAGASPKRGYFKLSRERQDDADTLDREQARIVNELIRKFAEDNREKVVNDADSSASIRQAAGSAATETYSDEPMTEAELFTLAAYQPTEEEQSTVDQEEDREDV